MKLPFDQLIIEADKILSKLASLTEVKDIIECWDEYLEFINACGWNNQEIDEEILKRVNKNWEIN